ncbi:hypothetical protein PXNS11_30079 [Stutzerimonas xanthomarina]|nr:hypothetical protein PXNS11_30079 [Stutzerimonas xanthomarina]
MQWSRGLRPLQPRGTGQGAGQRWRGGSQDQGPCRADRPAGRAVGRHTAGQLSIQGSLPGDDRRQRLSGCSRAPWRRAGRLETDRHHPLLSQRRLVAEHLQHSGGLGIGLAVEASRAVFHLERSDHVARLVVQMAVARHPVTLRSQCILEPGDRRQPGRCIAHPLGRHRIGVGPGQQPLLGQAFPGEQRPRIDLALRSDVAVADDGARLEVVTRHDVLEQHHQRVDLLRGVRIPEPAPVGAFHVAAVDQLNADRCGVEPGAPVPLTLAGMPGAAVFIHQPVDGRRRLADQVVAADVAAAEQLQRAGQVGRGVMQDDELGAAIVAGRAVAGIDARTTGATGQQQEHQDGGDGFHRDDLCVDGEMTQMSSSPLRGALLMSVR